MTPTRLSFSAFLVLVLVGFMTAAWFGSGLDESVRQAFEERAASRLGVPVRVRTVRVSLLSREVEIGGLRIGNPEGYQADHFLSAEKIEADFSLSSLFGATFEIGNVEVSGLDVQLENRRGRFNYQQITRAARDEPGEAAEASPGGRMLHVARARATGIRSTLTFTGSGLRLPAVRVDLPDLVLEDFGSGPGQRLPIEQVIRHFVNGLSRELLRQAAASSPGGWQRVLRGFTDSGTPAPPPQGLEEAVEGLDRLLRKP